MIPAQNPTIGILGGMGPLATADLFQKIVQMTNSQRDTDHPRILIDSNTNIPDRTQAILHGGADPLPEMIRSAVLLERGGADVLIMGCNTAHYFYDEITRYVSIPFLSMIEETAKAAQQAGCTCVGLLATDGTVQSGVYGREFARRGIQVLTPEPEDQKRVMDLIYQGVKSGKPDWPCGDIDRILSQFAAQGAGAVVLGCTELPVAFARYPIHSALRPLDPTEILAKQAVLAVGKELRPQYL